MKFSKILLIIIIASTALRLFLAVQAKGIYRGDEHEYLGLANEIVFGNVAFKQTFRPYSFSIIMAVPFAIAKILNVENPDTIILFARLLNVCFSVLLTYVVFLMGKKLFGVREGLIAAFLVGFSWFVTSWTIRVMTEVVSALFIMLSLYFAYDTKARTRLVLAGAFLGLASMMHLKNAVFLVPLLIHLLIKTKRHAIYFLSALAFMIVLQGAVDHFTSPYPFYSVLEYVKRTAILDYLSILLFEGGGPSSVYSLHQELFAGEQTLPFHWYFASIPKIVGLIIPVLVLISIEKDEKSYYLWGNAFVFIAITSLMPHKEERLIFPGIVILFILAARGFLRIWDSLDTGGANPHWALILLLIIFASNLLSTLSIPLETHYNENMAMNWIGKQNDITGVYSYYHYGDSGGYIYMRRDVPLYYEYLKKSGENIPEEINYVVVPDYLVEKYKQILEKKSFSKVKVFKTKYPDMVLSEEGEQDVYVYSR